MRPQEVGGADDRIAARNLRVGERFGGVHRSGPLRRIGPVAQVARHIVALGVALRRQDRTERSGDGLGGRRLEHVLGVLQRGRVETESIGPERGGSRQGVVRPDVAKATLDDGVAVAGRDGGEVDVLGDSVAARGQGELAEHFRARSRVVRGGLVVGAALGAGRQGGGPVEELVAGDAGADGAEVAGEDRGRARAVAAADDLQRNAEGAGVRRILQGNAAVERRQGRIVPVGDLAVEDLAVGGLVELQAARAVSAGRLDVELVLGDRARSLDLLVDRVVGEIDRGHQQRELNQRAVLFVRVGILAGGGRAARGHHGHGVGAGTLSAARVVDGHVGGGEAGVRGAVLDRREVLVARGGRVDVAEILDRIVAVDAGDARARAGGDVVQLAGGRSVGRGAVLRGRAGEVEERLVDGVAALDPQGAARGDRGNRDAVAVAGLAQIRGDQRRAAAVIGGDGGVGGGGEAARCERGAHHQLKFAVHYLRSLFG